MLFAFLLFGPIVERSGFLRLLATLLVIDFVEFLEISLFDHIMDMMRRTCSQGVSEMNASK